jgi:transposase-like protein
MSVTKRTELDTHDTAASNGGRFRAGCGNGVEPWRHPGKALTPEQRRIQEQEARCKRLEQEKDILKKATALLTD